MHKSVWRLKSKAIAWAVAGYKRDVLRGSSRGEEKSMVWPQIYERAHIFMNAFIFYAHAYKNSPSACHAALKGPRSRVASINVWPGTEKFYRVLLLDCG